MACDDLSFVSSGGSVCKTRSKFRRSGFDRKPDKLAYRDGLLVRLS
jgi:hypothetical protein